MRYIVAATCAGMIVLRAIWPELRLDSISLVLLAVALAALFLPELATILRHVKKLRIGEFEVELAQKLAALADRTAAVESSVTQQQRQPLVAAMPADDVATWLAAASTDPRASLVLLATEIERTVRELATAAELPDAGRPLLSRHLASLAERGVLDQRIVPLFRDFWSIRNSVVHGQHFELSQGKLYELLDLGLRILRLLRTGAGRLVTRDGGDERER